MKKFVLICLIFFAMLLPSSCASGNGYSGSFGTYSLLEARILESVDAGSQSLLVLEIRYTNSTDATQKPIDSIDGDLIIVNRKDATEVEAVLFNVVANKEKYGFTDEDIALIVNGSIDVEPGESVDVVVTAEVSHAYLDYLYLRDNNADYLNGTRYNVRITIGELH